MVFRKKTIFKQNKSKLPRIGLGVFTALILISVLLRQVKRKSKGLPTIIAHRGDYRHCVENTLDSLVAASYYRPDYVELDISEAKDGEIFVFHDSDFSRLADIDKKINEMSRHEIRDITLRQGGYEGKVPSLEEFILKAKELDQKLLVEIKIHGKESDNFVKNVIDLFNKHQVSKDYLIQSMDHEVIEEVRILDPTIQVGLVGVLPVLKETIRHLSFLSIPKYTLGIDLLQMNRLFHIPVFVWTIDNEDRALRVLKRGVDGIITGNSEDLLKHVREAID